MVHQHRAKFVAEIAASFLFGVIFFFGIASRAEAGRTVNANQVIVVSDDIQKTVTSVQHAGDAGSNASGGLGAPAAGAGSAAGSGSGAGDSQHGSDHHSDGGDSDHGSDHHSDGGESHHGSDHHSDGGESHHGSDHD